MRAGSIPRYGIDEILAITLVFAFIGPLVGTVVFAISLAILNTPTRGVWGISGLIDSLGIIIAGPVTGASYIAGGVPAAMAGLMVGIKSVYFGGASWRVALGAGVLVGIALDIFVAVFIAPHDLRLAGILVIVTTLSSLACWRMFRFWLKVRA